MCKSKVYECFTICKRLKIVTDAVKAAGAAIRVGINSGSLEKDILANHGVTAAAIVKSQFLLPLLALQLRIPLMYHLSQEKELSLCQQLIFKKGTILKKVNEDILLKEFENILKEDGII